MKYHVYPKHSDTLPYLLKNLTRSFNYLFIYLKLPDKRHSVKSLNTLHSALGPWSGWVRQRCRVSCVTGIGLQLAKVCNPCSW